jgi:hypothetical protein
MICLSKLCVPWHKKFLGVKYLTGGIEEERAALYQTIQVMGILERVIFLGRCRLEG